MIRLNTIALVAVSLFSFPFMAFSQVADSVSLPDVVVTGTRDSVDVRHLPMTVTVIGREDLTKSADINVLPVAMRQVPGLIVSSRSVMGYGVSTGAAGGISLRGLSGSSGQLLMLIDGHPQYNGIYGHPISDSYQTLMAERVEVLRGPASMLYGSNAMGGVLNIVTRKMDTDGSKTGVSLGAGSYGTFQSEASNQFRSGKFSSTVALQYARSDNHRAHMGFEQYGGFIKLGYDVTPHWKLSGDLDLTHWNASNPDSVTQPKLDNDQWITRGAATLALENNFARTSGALSVYDNFGRHKINDGYNAQGGTPQTDLFRSKDAVAGVSFYQSVRLFSGNRLTAGFDYQHIYGHAYYTDRITGDIVRTPKRLMQSAHEHENELAGYLNLRQDITKWFTLDAGLRYDRHSVAGGEWIPQAGAVWRPLRSAEMKVLASKGFRNPTMREMYMYGTANHDSLSAERLWNYEWSWRHRVGSFTYALNAFYIKGDNLIQTVAGRNVNTGEIENYGAELEAKYAVNDRLTVSTDHALLHMRYKVVAAPNYKGGLNATYSHSRWTLSAGLQCIRDLYTSVGATSTTTENFCLLNMSASYDVTKRLRLWVNGDNLLAQDYEFNLGYPMPHATFMGGINFQF